MLSRIPIPCPECHQTVKVRIEYIGLQVQCNRCGHPFRVPRTLAVACPECGLSETFRAEDLGRVVRCNRCDAVYEALAIERIQGPSNPGGAATASPEPSEPHRPPPRDGSAPDFVVPPQAERAVPGDDGRPARLAVMDDWRDERAASDPSSPTGELASTSGHELERLDDVVRGKPVGADPADDGGLPPAVESDAPELPSRDPAPDPVPSEAPLELDRLRIEAESLRIMASEAERLRAECDALRDQARERAASEESLRSELEEVRSALGRLGSEAAALRDGAASSEQLEDELRAACEEVTRLRADCQESRAAAAAATGEVEALLAHSSTLQDGFYLALAEIEAHPSERLVPPREAERLRARLGELESQVAEALAARRAVEEEAARALRARESELAALREELRTMQTQMREPAELEAEEQRPGAVLARERVDHDDVSAELADFLSSVARSRGRREVAGTPPGQGLAGVVRLQGEPVEPSKTPLGRAAGSDRVAVPVSPAGVSASEVDFALEQIDLREFSPPTDVSSVAQLAAPAPEAPVSPIIPDIATGPIAGRGAPEQPESDAGPPVAIESPEAEAHRRKAEVLQFISQGRKREAEILSRQMVELIRATAGELSPDFSMWMTVVGQLQAEQGDLAGARSTFDRKNAIFRDEFGERDPRYLTGLANSADALLACGDVEGARALFEEAEAGCLPTFDAAHPFTIAIRHRLERLRGHKPGQWTMRVST